MYDKWIKENVPVALGKCAEATVAMASAFPELRRVRGWYYCPIWGEREHWYLIGPTGIVDPTASQFPSKGNGAYVEFKGPEPTGQCAGCGAYIYDGSYFCLRCEA